MHKNGMLSVSNILRLTEVILYAREIYYLTNHDHYLSIPIKPQKAWGGDHEVVKNKQNETKKQNKKLTEMKENIFLLV